MKSPLNPKALELSDLKNGMEVARVDYQDGKVTAAIRRVPLSRLTVKSVDKETGKVVLTDSRNNHQLFRAAELGVAPYADGKMSRYHCLMTWSDAMELMAQYDRDNPYPERLSGADELRRSRSLPM